MSKKLRKFIIKQIKYHEAQADVWSAANEPDAAGFHANEANRLHRLFTEIHGFDAITEKAPKTDEA